MSHIFISYARKDKAKLDKVYAWLSEKNFAEKEIWRDQNIEGGSNWNNEIFDALDNAFAVLVLVTSNLLDSNFCTIEWAYALGQGIPVFPLLLEDVDFTKIPPPLASKQIINALEILPDALKDNLSRLKSVAPEVQAINTMIYETIFDTHRRFFILNWIGRGLESLGSSELRKDLLGYFVEEASQAKRSLELLMLEKAFALSGKQHRLCWQLVDILKKISLIQVEYTEYLLKDFEADFDTWLMAFDFFDVEYGWWHNGIKRYFDSNLEYENIKMSVVVEMTRVFPMLHAYDADVLIRNKNIDLKLAK